MKNLLFPFSCLLLLSALRGQQEIMGPVTPEDLSLKFPEWQAVAAAYAPRPEAVDRLRAVTCEVIVEVVLGTWCSDSKSHVSKFLKVLEVTDNPLIRATYIGVPKDKTKRSPYLQGRDIVKIPTFLIYVDGVEKGRIIESPVKTVEQDLADIIEK
jgi:thiol-disulfide isomerase/thioredoxin